MNNMIGKKGKDRRLHPRNSIEPEFWGIEKHSARRILQELAGTVKPRPKPLDAPKVSTLWSENPKQPGGLIDATLTTTSMSFREASEQLNARWGLQYSAEDFASKSLRPIVPAGAMTPAAQRMLLMQHDPRTRSHSTPLAREGMLGLVHVRRSTEGLPDSSWRTMFTDTQNFSRKQLASQSVDNIRQDHGSGLMVRKKGSTARLTASRSLDTIGSDSASLKTKLLIAGDYLDMQALETKIKDFNAKFKFAETVELLTDLKVIRQFVSKPVGETGVIGLLKCMNESCSALEEAARKEASNANRQKASKEANKEDEQLLVLLERLRQHRRFVLEEYESFQSRPQAVLERALLTKISLPVVYRNALRNVQAGESEAVELVSKFEDIKIAPKDSTGAAVALAILKARIRDMCLEGSLQTAQSKAVTAANFRVLVAEVGLRTIQTRKILLDKGIPVEGNVLQEILRRDESLFPSAFDYNLAKKAVQEAKNALKDLEDAINRDQEIENNLRKEHQALEAKQRAEENEIRKIEESEKQLEFNKKVVKSKHARAMLPAIHKEIWSAVCGGSSGRQLGGAVAMYGAHIYATADDNDIWVYDLSHKIFDFCKNYRLTNGHSQTVTCLAVLGGHTLFSGSMDHNVCVWDVERDFVLEEVLLGHTEAVTCLAIADNNPGAKNTRGKFLCSGSFDMTIRIWEGIQVQEEEEEDAVDPGPKRIKVSWQCMRTLFGHGCFIHSIVTHGKYAFSGGEDGLIKVWDATVKHSIGQLEGCRDTIYSLCMRTEQAGKEHAKEIKQLLSSGIDYGIKAWNLHNPNFEQYGIGLMEDSLVFNLTPDSVVHEARSEVAKIEHDMEIAVTEDGKLLLRQSLDQANKALDNILQWQAGLGYVKSLAYSKGYLYSAGAEDLVRVWNLDLNTCIGTLEGMQRVYNMTIDNTSDAKDRGDLLGVCSRDNRVRLFGTPERAEAMAKGKKTREENFIKDGGEMWLYDFVNDHARLLLPRIHIRQVSCGKKHGIALDNEGHVWAWGSSARGQCGLGTKENVEKPRRIDHAARHVSIENQPVKAVAAGWFHSLLLMESGTVYACGENDVGQLGLLESEESQILNNERAETLKKHEALPEGEEKGNLLKRINDISAAHAMANMVYTLEQVIVVEQANNISITGIAAGGRHSVFVDESGAAWACGWASEGQLGVDLKGAGVSLLVGQDGHAGYYVRKPMQMMYLESVTVAAAKASIVHTLLLTTLGRVFCCGSNDSGQLGIGATSEMPVQFTQGNCLLRPCLIKALREKKVVSFDAGTRHSIFLTDGGYVYACGAKGPNGHPHNNNIPELLPPFNLEDGTDTLSAEKGEGRGRGLDKLLGGKGKGLEPRLISVSPGGAGGEYSFISTANGNAFIAGPTPIVRPVVALGQGAGIEASSNGQTKKRGIKDLVEPRVRPQYHSVTGNAWRVKDMHPVGLVPIGPISRFGDEVPGLQSLDEFVGNLQSLLKPLAYRFTGGKSTNEK